MKLCTEQSRLYSGWVSSCEKSAAEKNPDKELMYHLYLDESGELGLKSGSSQFFVVTVLSTAHPKALAKRVRKEKASTYLHGFA